MTLKIGDVVELKTGGPRMTVNRVGPIGTSEDGCYLDRNEVETAWFEVDASDCWGGAFTQRFGADALNKVNDAPAQGEAA